MINYFHSVLQKLLVHEGFKRYFFNTSWVFAEQVLRIVAELLVGIWVARYLGPERLGIFSYVIAFVAIFSMLAKLGLDGILVKYLVIYPDKRDVYLSTAFWLKFFGAIVTLILVSVSTLFTSNDHETNVYILIIATGMVFQSFEVIDFYFQSKVLSKFVAISKLIQLIVSSLAKVYLVMTEADLLWFVIVSFIDQVTIGLSLYLAYKYQKIGTFYNHFDWNTAKQLLKDSYPLIIGGLAVMIYMRIDQVMIKEMIGEKAVGIYSVAVRLSEAWYFIPMIIANSIFPAIVNAKKISESLYYTRLERLYSIMIWIAIFLAIPMTFCSDWIITFLYGEAYKDAGKILAMLIWTGVFVFLGVASRNWFLSENLQKYATINMVVGAISNIILNLILIPLYGVYGAAIATMLSYAIASYLMNYIFEATRAHFYRLSKAIDIRKMIIKGKD